MKLAYIATILFVVFLVGCATQPTAPSDNAPVATDEPPTLPSDEGTATTSEPPTVPGMEATAEVILNGKAGFDPDQIKIKAGDTLTVLVRDSELETSGNTSVVQKEHKFAINGIGPVSGSLKDGERFDYTFEETGTYKLQDLTFKQYLTVIV